MKAKHEEWHQLEQVAIPTLKEKNQQVTAKQLSKGLDLPTIEKQPKGLGRDD